MASSVENARPVYCYSMTTLGLDEHMSYNVSMSGSNEISTVIPAGIFRFTIKAFLDHAPRVPMLCTPSTPIPSQTFFQEGHDFLRTLLSPLSARSFFCPEIIEQIIDLVAFEVRDLFQLDAAAPSSSESQPTEIPLWVVIRVTENAVFAATQNSATLGFRMFPATRKAIETMLKKSRVVRSEYCSVCLEELVVNAECYKMPCDHLFHQECIVRWLHTSHTCPLCRYPLLILKE